MAENGTSTGRYIVEFDGVSAVRSTEVSGVGIDHTPFELWESNRPNPHNGRGHFKVDEIKVKHGSALNSTGEEVFQWVKDFVEGRDVERRTFRLIKLDEDGRSPIETWECYECVPKKFSSENSTAGGNDAAYFSFSILPEDLEYIIS